MKTPLAYLTKMGRREVRSSWAQFLAIIAIGGIAVTLFVGLLANAESIEKRVDAAYDGGNMADLWVTTSSYDPDDLATIRDIVGDDGAVEGRFEAPGRLARNSLYTVILPTMPSISKPYQMDEKAPEQTSTHFVIVDYSLAHSTSEESNKNFVLGASIGISYDLSSFIKADQASQLVPLVKAGGTNILAADSLRLTYTITGIMHYPENVTKATYNSSAFLVDDATFKKEVLRALNDNYTQQGVDLILQQLATSDLSWGDGTRDPETLCKSNQYLVSLQNHGDVSSIQTQIQAAFAKKTENNLYNLSNRESMPFVQTMHNDVLQARQFTFVFPFVFFFVAILVILTTISQIILKERTQIGTMKALGLSNQEIYAHYLGLTMAVVGIGIVIGEVLGPIIIPFILGQKYDILYTLPERGYVFPVLYGVLTAVFFLGTAALVAFLVCHKEVKLKPAESMRPNPPKFKAHETQLVLKKNETRYLSLKMAFRNIKVDLVKSIMVISGVMGCTALLACGYGIEDTIDYGKNHDMAHSSMTNDAVLSLTFSVPQSPESLANDLKSIPGIASFEPITRTATTARLDVSGAAQSNTNVYLLSRTTGSHMDWGDQFGVDEIGISEKIANETGAKKGDALRFEYGSQSFVGTVGLVYEAFFFNGVVVHASASMFSSLGSLSFQGAYVDVTRSADKSDLEAAQAVKEELVDGEHALSYLIEADTTADWTRQIDDIMSGVLIMTNAVKVFAILLAIVVLYNLALLNFRERTRDIATLKVLGFSKREIANSLLWETMSLTAVGVLFGLLLGYPFMLAVLKLNQVSLVQYLYYIYPISYVFSFLLTFMVAFGVNAILSYGTGKVKMVESLKSVE